MAYTLVQFITQAQGGGAVKITKAVGDNRNTVIKIGQQVVELQDVRNTISVSNGVKTEVKTAANVLDLGTLFTAAEVLDSYQLRQAIIDGLVIAEAGTQALAVVPTKAIV
jgi:hypothetical protein